MVIKKAISSLLIILILSHGVSHFFVFKVFEAKFKKEIKQMIKDGFPEDKLVSFSFHRNIEAKPIENFRWMKKNEFRYEGEMYDIIRTEVRSDSIYYTCIHDVKESKLFANLENHIGDFLKKNPDKNDDLFSFINSLSKLYNQTEFISIELYSKHQSKYPNQVFYPLERDASILTPPPKS